MSTRIDQRVISIECRNLPQQVLDNHYPDFSNGLGIRSVWHSISPPPLTKSHLISSAWDHRSLKSDSTFWMASHLGHLKRPRDFIFWLFMLRKDDLVSNRVTSGSVFRAQIGASFAPYLISWGLSTAQLPSQTSQQHPHRWHSIRSYESSLPKLQHEQELLEQISRVCILSKLLWPLSLYHRFLWPRSRAYGLIYDLYSVRSLLKFEVNESTTSAKSLYRRPEYR